jgi:hypothetical protein
LLCQLYSNKYIHILTCGISKYCCAIFIPINIYIYLHVVFLNVYVYIYWNKVGTAIFRLVWLNATFNNISFLSLRLSNNHPLTHYRTSISKLVWFWLLCHNYSNKDIHILKCGISKYCCANFIPINIYIYLHVVFLNIAVPSLFQ